MWNIHIDGLVQDCNIPIANALVILQSCTKLSLFKYDDVEGQNEEKK